MLPNEKNDLLYLLNILEYIGKIWKYTENAKNAEELFELNEQMNLNASLTLLSNIGENVSKITEKLKQDYSNIEWIKIKDFRNRIVHDYVGIDLAIVYEIISKDLNVLKPNIENIINEKIKQNVFDIEELKISKKSTFYKYMAVETIDALETVLKTKNILEKYNLDKIGVFGSFARGEIAKDIDFYIDLENYNIKNLIKLKQDLEKITQKEVDIMIKKYANPIILYRAQKDMKYVTR
jgi:uncharacterized protein with HEPN domain/predicted nucleotidyltransferase